MLNRSMSLWLGALYVLIGAINVWLILQASARVRDAKASTRLIAAHRIGGYVFIALFCLIGYFMVARLGDIAAGAPPSTMIHLTLAMVLSPLIFVKVLVARYYKSYYSLLMPIGLVMRLCGKDPLRLRRDPDAPSYWLVRDPPGPAPETMKNQF